MAKLMSFESSSTSGFRQSFKKFIRKHGTSNVIQIVSLLVIIAALPLTLVLSKQTQDNRQHAQTSSLAALPLCPTHDPTKWHALIQYDANGTPVCHYNHEHKENPNDPDIVKIFGPVGAYTNGQEISYPWQTFKGGNETYPPEPTDPTVMENYLKHGFYGWMVRKNLPCVSQQDFRKPDGDAWGCITDFRLEEHGDMAALGSVTRFHSFWVEARVCPLTNPTDCGIIRRGGWIDSGHLLVPEPTIVPLPGDPPCPDLSCNNGKRLHQAVVNGQPVPGDVRSGDATWYSQSGFAEFGWRGEAWGPVDPSNPSVTYFYEPANPWGTTWVNGIKHDHNASWITSEILGFNIYPWTVNESTLTGYDATTHKMNWKGYTDRYGKYITDGHCTQISLDCIPAEITNVSINPNNNWGHYIYRDSDGTMLAAIGGTLDNPHYVPGGTLEHDTAPADVDWIMFNPSWASMNPGSGSTLPSPMPTSTPIPTPTVIPNIPTPTPTITPLPTATGTLSGSVASTNGLTICQVRVSLVYNGAKQTAYTNCLGQYSLFHVPAGSYSVTYTKNHYTTKKITVLILGGQTTTQNVQLVSRK